MRRSAQGCRVIQAIDADPDDRRAQTERLDQPFLFLLERRIRCDSLDAVEVDADRCGDNRRVASVQPTPDASVSISAPSSSSTASRKFRRSRSSWKASRSLASSPVRISCRHGQMRRRSGYGHGMCQNSAVLASGRRARSAGATSARW